jgi:hypothetical protein
MLSAASEVPNADRHRAGCGPRMRVAADAWGHFMEFAVEPPVDR